MKPTQPAMCCPYCGGMDLRRSSRSDGVRDSGRRVPGQLCGACKGWWPIAVGKAS